MSLKRLSATVVACASLLFVAACTTKSADKPAADTTAVAPAAPNVVTFKAVDFAFQGPDTIPAGLTTIRMDAGGKELHQLSIFRIDSGKTYDEVKGALKNPNGPPPKWFVEVVGVNPPVPGHTAEVTANLDAGRYMMLCFIPSPDGVPHMAKGMVKPLTVVGTAVAAAEPKADVQMTLTDYDFVLSTPFTAGQHTIRVVNTAPQAHEVFLVRLAPGKSAQDLVKWVDKMQGPPPAEPMGGVTGLASGGYAYFPAQLEAGGSYALLCFLPDAKDGKPHVMHGMVKEFKVS